MIFESLMKLLAGIAKSLWSARREKIVEKRETRQTLAAELDKLADLMADVLSVTAPDGHIRPDRVSELEVIRQRVWNRWVSILSTDAYDVLDPELLAEIEKVVKVAHAAPGAYVEEIYLVQIGLANGHVPREVRDRFARSIDAIRDATVRMRLNA